MNSEISQGNYGFLLHRANHLPGQYDYPWLTDRKDDEREVLKGDEALALSYVKLNPCILHAGYWSFRDIRTVKCE